ncbi:MAG: beta-galactosidase trimerization domain-containing protein, partial [Planctomycetota bacterium]
LDSFRSDAKDVGVLFSQQSYYLHWCLDAQKQAGDSFLGCCSALMKAGIGFKAIDENHLDALDGVKILLMPRVLVTDAALEERLISFVNNGGTLVAETECGAYSPVGIFRYPEERFLKRLANVSEIGRRTPPAPDQRLTVSHTGRDFQIQWNQWLTVFDGPFKDIMATHPDGALAARLPVGKGHLVCIGTHVADSWRTSRDMNLVGFYQSLCNVAGHQPNVKSTTGDGLIRTGRSGKKRLAFAFCDGDEKTLTLTFGSDWKTNRVKELISGKEYELKNHSATFDVPELKILVIASE